MKHKLIIDGNAVYELDLKCADTAVSTAVVVAAKSVAASAAAE